MSTFRFAGSVPGVYDQDLGPFLFHGTADALASRVRAPSGGRVLEVACGTGISTAALRRALPSDVEIVATDLNEGMLAEARRRRGDLEHVSFQTADAQSLPFADGTFDAVVCQFGLMFFPDKVGALREALRVTRLGGQILFSVWDSLDRNPAVRVIHETIQASDPESPPRFLETPFGFHDRFRLHDVFEAAGTRHIRIEVDESIVELPSARGPAVGLVCGTPGVAELHDRGVAVEALVDEAERAAAAAFGEAPFRAPLSALFVHGCR